MGQSADRKKLLTAAVINALVVVAEIWAITLGVQKHGFAGNFIFYTECSNLLGAIVCACCLAFEIRALRLGTPLPRGLKWAKYAASCCLLMTFFVVLFILMPMLYSIGSDGFFLMFVDGAKPVTHFGAPIAVCASYVLFEADRRMTLKQSLVGFVPTLVYAAVAYPCNIARVWDGPYPFFQVWNMPIWQSVLWFAALFLLAFGICQIPRLLAKRIRD